MGNLRANKCQESVSWFRNIVQQVQNSTFKYLFRIMYGVYKETITCQKEEIVLIIVLQVDVEPSSLFRGSAVITAKVWNIFKKEAKRGEWIFSKTNVLDKLLKSSFYKFSYRTVINFIEKFGL